MYIRRLLILGSLAIITACGGGGGSGNTSTPSTPEIPSTPTGYDPSVAVQTLTADQLADVSEIVSTTTVTVEEDVKIASDAKDLVVKGNLIIK